MAKIRVGGLKAADAPSPVQLSTWYRAWVNRLAGLTNWNPNADKTEYSATTTASVSATEAVVDNPLQTWVDKDSGHRHYSVT